LDDVTRLSLIRTLLAAERNYMAIERTQLSELRTGSTLALIAPTVASALPYFFSSYLVTTYVEIAVYILLTALTIFGIYISVNSYKKLKRAEAVQKLIRSRQREIANEMEITKTYFEDIMAYTVL
jgi:uncharacterized membrane protein YidH (DUF202 family)